MITRDVIAFSKRARAEGADFGPPTATGVFLISPVEFVLAMESAVDNKYMDVGSGLDPERAARQHAALVSDLERAVATRCFPGVPESPDGLFCNNVFGTAPGRLVIGRMRHAIRQREAERPDVRGYFAERGYREIDLRAQAGICELTGALVIDRARGLGFCGLSERCDAAGAAAMHEAFGLRAMLVFDLAPGEYHTNVVLSVLAGRAVVVAPSGFADPSVASAIEGLYPTAVRLGLEEKKAFAGNCLAATPDAVWLSERARDGLSEHQRGELVRAGFTLRAVPLDEIEKAGGSVRCCIGEIF